MIRPEEVEQQVLDIRLFMRPESCVTRGCLNRPPNRVAALIAMRAVFLDHSLPPAGRNPTFACM
jgi:hypothetical protein